MGKRGFDLAALARASMGVSGPEASRTRTVSDNDPARDASGAVEGSVFNLDTVQEIDAGRIMANEANFYEMTELEELAASIELVGLLHPVLVMPDGGDGGYILIDGERRFRAMTDVLHRETVPCIVRRPANDVIEELMLIEANRTQRKISAAELSRQAERYTELLAALRESGAEIPGRLRDRVAEALDVSASKLARLHAIRQKLRPALLKKFDDGKLSESVAYEYSKMDRMGQADAWSAGLITAEDVRRFAARRKEAAGQARTETPGLADGSGTPPGRQREGPTSSPQKAVQAGLPPTPAKAVGEPIRASSIITAAACLGVDLTGSAADAEAYLTEMCRQHASHWSDECEVDCRPGGKIELDSGGDYAAAYTVKAFVCLLRECLTEQTLRRRKTVSELDTDDGPGFVWHDTLQDGPPPEGARNVICWGGLGTELYKPVSTMLDLEFQLNGDSTCRFWAIVTGPEGY